jgi:hypothetical protein
MHFVVMENLSPTHKYVSECYDLKGSSVGRKATDSEKQKKGAILKDLDFNRRLFLGPEKRQSSVLISFLPSFFPLTNVLFLFSHQFSSIKSLETVPSLQNTMLWITVFFSRFTTFPNRLLHTNSPSSNNNNFLLLQGRHNDSLFLLHHRLLFHSSYLMSSLVFLTHLRYLSIAPLFLPPHQVVDQVRSRTTKEGLEQRT